MRKCLHYFSEVVRVELFDCGDTAFDSHTHVIACVSVGYREYVQLVDLVGVMTKLCRSAHSHLSHEKSAKITEGADFFPRL